MPFQRVGRTSEKNIMSVRTVQRHVMQLNSKTFNHAHSYIQKADQKNVILRDWVKCHI